MTKTQHTPGPWVQGVEYYSRHVYGCGQTVASAFGHDEGEANARLIAAAPDLLETLDTLWRMSVQSDRAKNDIDYRDALANAKAVIDRAKGGAE